MTRNPSYALGSIQRISELGAEPPVYRLTRRDHVELALSDAGSFSNAPYKLGADPFTFMLALDGGMHARQRAFGIDLLKFESFEIDTLVRWAYDNAATLPLKRAEFDLVELAEQVAVRFTAFLFGFTPADVPRLELALRKGYEGLIHQIVGRHQAHDPRVEPAMKVALGGLAKRTAELIGQYATGRAPKEVNELKAAMQRPHKAPFSPVCERLALRYPGLPVAEQTGNVVSLMVGMVGNIQASVALAVAGFFESTQPGRPMPMPAQSLGAPAFEAQVSTLLGQSPPVPFLTRKLLKDVTLPGEPAPLPAGAIVVLAMGEGAAGGGVAGDRVAFGQTEVVAGTGRAVHDCIGKHLAQPLVNHTVREVLRLPGLAQVLDPDTGKPRGLTRHNGFQCVAYPLRYHRDRRLTQQPLKVVMSVKQPVTEHAESLRRVIRYGAPLIERVLRDAEHVHFAWFMFLENDSKLMLTTVYDRDFDAYIEHFALKIAPLWEEMFKHLEDAPPMPTDQYAREFVETIRRFDQPAVEGYFFSACPSATVSAIKTCLATCGG